jgi:hypothetical protein
VGCVDNEHDIRQYVRFKIHTKQCVTNRLDEDEES